MAGDQHDRGGEGTAGRDDHTGDGASPPVPPPPAQPPVYDAIPPGYERQAPSSGAGAAEDVNDAVPEVNDAVPPGFEPVRPAGTAEPAGPAGPASGALPPADGVAHAPAQPIPAQPVPAPTPTQPVTPPPSAPTTPPPAQPGPQAGPQPGAAPEPVPGFGPPMAAAGGFGAPGQGAVPPGYGAPQPGYGGAPQSGYGATPPAYGATPPAYGATPPAYGAVPPGQGGGFPLPPLAPGPSVPPPPPGPANPAQAAAVALLNLSGLGLGYVLLKKWAFAAVCWAAVIALLVVALPADPDGIPLGVLVAFGIVQLLAAADGARRALRARPETLALPDRRKFVLPVALVLLVAIPGGGTFAYGAARDEAVEQSLLDRLAVADGKVKKSADQSFDTARATYRDALDTYQELGTQHAGSRAAGKVPDRLQAYYKAVSSPYDRENFCGAIAPLKHLRSLPEVVDRGLLGDLVGKADDPLARSLFECGVNTIGAAGTEQTAADQFNEVTKTFPDSPYPARIEPALRAKLKAREQGMDSSPCETAEDLQRFTTTLTRMPSATYGKLAGDAERSAWRGEFGCGISQFKDKKFEEAVTTMDAFVKNNPSSSKADQARNVSIAAEIAQETDAAGKKVPSGATAGGSGQQMVISNDGPGEVQVLFTGPVTGRITIPACGSCKAYPGILIPKSGLKPCSGSSSKYPKRTLYLPPGTYQFLQKRNSTTTSAEVKKASSDKIESGYSYTNCLYVTSLY
ncbi:hypothetical protein [Streptomyces laurentii]|uniref:hypothetical protein n=1 Tax=Streptomyces laurentii TaxID=39478 RepID=UPI0036B4D734